MDEETLKKKIGKYLGMREQFIRERDTLNVKIVKADGILEFLNFELQQLQKQEEVEKEEE